MNDQLKIERPLSKRAYIETYGCQMNVHDSERAASLLSAIDYQIVDSPGDADLVVLNTCAVREKASGKVFSRASQLRGSGSGRRDAPVIAVMGCVGQSEAESIFEKAPEVKIVLGPSALSSLPDLVRQIEDGFPRAIEIRKDADPDFLEISSVERRVTHLAYVTIIEGCDKVCSYCIVPYTRGRERSRPAESILAEARSLGQAGFKEIQLLGQNVNSYKGRHLEAKGGKECSFSELLELVATSSGVPRIKYTTSHPIDFSEEIVRVMDNHQNLCNWIHLPVQSGSTRVLSAMRREYTREEYLKKIQFIRKAKRDYAITTDVIVGFPGESEQDFKETLSLVEEVCFDGVFMFLYSPRPHSSAFNAVDDVPSGVKRERLHRLQELQAEIQSRIYNKYLGQIVDVLVESIAAKGSGELSGHTTCNKVVNFKGISELLGSMEKVEITEACKNSLKGNLK